jgi:hypothetical protein
MACCNLGLPYSKASGYPHSSQYYDLFLVASGPMSIMGHRLTSVDHFDNIDQGVGFRTMPIGKMGEWYHDPTPYYVPVSRYTGRNAASNYDRYPDKAIYAWHRTKTHSSDVN